MKKLGVVMCNYNGKKYAEHCLSSLMAQDVGNIYDIYLVDNASTDGSAEYISNQFGEKVNILEMPENLGGSGRFNKGMELCLKQGYQFLLLLDNDASFCDKDTVRKMLEIMESDMTVGMLGTKVLIESRPEVIQEFGGYIDFDNYEMRLGHRYDQDSGNCPAFAECDYIAACAVMIRAEALKKAGTFPKENFIYWDDIELGFRIKEAGYRVCAAGDLRVRHRGNYGRPSTSTVSQYYFTRNWLNFFAKYTPEQKWDQMTDSMLQKIFDRLYNCYIQGQIGFQKSYLMAFLDFLYGINGKAGTERIFSCDQNHARLEGILTNLTEVTIQIQKNRPEATAVKLRIEKTSPGMIIKEAADDEDSMKRTVFRICDHIKNVQENILPVIWIDPYGNVIDNTDIYESYRDYKRKILFFVKLYKPVFLKRVHEMRKK